MEMAADIDYRILPGGSIHNWELFLDLGNLPKHLRFSKITILLREKSLSKLPFQTSKIVRYECFDLSKSESHNLLLA